MPANWRIIYRMVQEDEGNVFKCMKQRKAASSNWHLSEAERPSIGTKQIEDKLIVAWHLGKLCPAEVGYRHGFKLADCTPICLPFRWIPEEIKMIVRQDIETMLKAKVLKPAKSPWVIPVVIARRKDC